MVCLCVCVSECVGSEVGQGTFVSAMLQEVEISVVADKLRVNYTIMPDPLLVCKPVCVCARVKQFGGSLCLRWMIKCIMCMNMTSRK